MIFKTPTGLKKFSLFAAAWMGLVLANSRPVGAGASDYPEPDTAKQRPSAIIVGQSQTGTSTPETDSRPSESAESESRAEEGQNSTAAEKKPLKDFQPTEKIEADQAVDFPYDI